jgi:hypothetical protein
MNIWEVVCVSDLIKILKDSPQQFIILGIVLETTPKSNQVIIKKFLKEKSKHFPNMKFLYFKANQKDLGKISLLDKDETKYPYVYHIYDTTNIFIKVHSANQQSLIEAYNEGEQYYKKNLQEYLAMKEQVENQNQNQKEDIDNNKKKENNNKKQGDEKKKIKVDNTPEVNMEEWAKQQSELETQQKIIEKIVTFQQRAKDFNLELLKDIQHRKVEEDKIRRK